jgi:hypothetical protein
MSGPLAAYNIRNTSAAASVTATLEGTSVVGMSV